MNCEKCGEPLGRNDKAVEIELDPTIAGIRDFVACSSCAKEVIKGV